MKFRIKTQQEWSRDKIKKIESWNKKFAWKWVRLTNDDAEVRWLEFIYRKGSVEFKYRNGRRIPCGHDWQYIDATDLVALKLKEQD